jgi:hypothetical protein
MFQNHKPGDRQTDTQEIGCSDRVIIITSSSPPIANIKGGSSVDKWTFKPGPATSASAPRAWALKALHADSSIEEVNHNTWKCTQKKNPKP